MSRPYANQWPRILSVIVLSGIFVAGFRLPEQRDGKGEVYQTQTYQGDTTKDCFSTTNDPDPDCKNKKTIQQRLKAFFNKGKDKKSEITPIK